MDIIFLVCILIVVIIIVVTIRNSFVYSNLRKKFVNGTATEEEKSKFKKLVAERNTSLQRNEENAKRTTIKKVMIVGNNSDSRKKVGSSIMRGAVGGALLGPVGLVGGAMSGKNKITNETTFLIEYADGHRETKVVDNNSSEFQKLCQYLEM